MNHLILNSKGQVQYHDNYESNYVIEKKCDMCLDWTNNDQLYVADAPEEYITLINKGKVIVCSDCIQVINEYNNL